MTASRSGWHRKNPHSPAALARARDYRSPTHKQIRALLHQQIQTGIVSCCRCAQRIDPGTPWHLDHSDDRATYLGAAHAACNLKAAASKGAQAANAKRRPRLNVSRQWR